MHDAGADAFLGAILALGGDRRWEVDRAAVRRDVTAYAVRSPDGEDLVFSLPVVVRRQILSEFSLDPRGSAGAVALVIERAKERARTDRALGPLAGRGTRSPHRFAAWSEPYTIVSSPAALASHIWHAGGHNRAGPAGIHLVVAGAVPCPDGPPPRAAREFAGTVEEYCGAIADVAFSVPDREIEAAWLLALDQEILREKLPGLGLVSFVGDGSRLARTLTRHRCIPRVAGPKEGVSVPFACPEALSPVEVELPASNRTATGLGIRRREVFAVAGSNAEGKTTFLEGILSGVDTHAAGDGREMVVTVPGACTAEATQAVLSGADVSMFFSRLPPGMGGTVHAASGLGSGSVSMAYQVQRAISRGCPLLLVDEDRSAPNLLVRSALQGDGVTPLSEIVSRHRGRLGDTALVIAACAMDTLVAHADRIMVLEGHAARAVDRERFRREVALALERAAAELRGGPRVARADGSVDGLHAAGERPGPRG
ncbi:MAG: ABC-ATPase domain-containing protein [Methanolinea sp.]|nr:ABC-ATPase domain-containing protein [Methanolinea sp.]